MKNLFLRIEDNYSGFSKGQRAVANYILNNYDKAAFSTAAKIGKTVGVSESTVVRFATEIGYDGYPMLQKAMKQMVKTKLTSFQRIEVTEDRIGNADILDSVLYQDIENIKHTLLEVLREDFFNAVDMLLKADKKYILATRSSIYIGSFLCYYLNLIFDEVSIINTACETEIYEKLLNLGENDAVIGISFPRYSKQVVKAMNFSKKRGANVIALTDSMTSPLKQSSDCLLLAKSDMASIVDSLVAPLSLVNALIVVLAMKRKTYVSDKLKKLENIWEEYEVYEKSDERNPKN